MVDLTLPDASPPQDLGDASGRLVARVQAWQQRHPLARRLSAADITGLGVIALPFGSAEPGGSPQPLFHQPSLLPGLSHRTLVDFALRHAVSYRPGPADWPQRDVDRSDASAEPAPETRYLLTAAVTEPVAPGAQPRRLLIAPEGSAIWGPRPLSRARVTAALVGLALALGAAGWGLRAKWSGRAPVPAASTPASAIAVAPSAPSARSAAVASEATAATAASIPASATTPARPVPPAAASAPRAASSPAAPSVVRGASAVVAMPAASVAKAAASAALAVPAPSQSGPPSAAVVPAPGPVPPPKLLPMPTLRGGASASAAAPAPAPAASV
ncbi:MAG TPA: hypothetical protein VFY73_14555, partial [Ideonella sp.]|nr:hypothetical protein [Ideonella sp.]